MMTISGRLNRERHCSAPNFATLSLENKNLIPVTMHVNGGPDSIPAQFNSVSVQTDPSLRRDDELWFATGNLVLIAREVEFRIWKAPLIKHSPVFKDMLSLPQDAASSEIASDMGGCAPPAAVHLLDSPEDLRHFLRAFVPGKTLRP